MKTPNFKTWLALFELSTVGTEDVNSSQIEALYSKAKQSVRLVRDYDAATGQKLLTNISTIASLAQGNAYGLFVSNDNAKAIGADVLNKIKMIYPSDPSLNQKLQKLPKSTILKYLPNIDANKIIPSDVIRVDVQGHLRKYGDSPAAIIEIASTIVHEATHVKQYEEEGHTEDGPGTAVEKAEASFKSWVRANWEQLSAKYGFQGPYPF